MATAKRCAATRGSSNRRAGVSAIRFERSMDKRAWKETKKEREKERERERAARALEMVTSRDSMVNLDARFLMAE